MTLGKKDLIGDLILPVKANPDLPIKLLPRRSRELKKKCGQYRRTRKLMKLGEKDLIGDLILPV